MDDKEIIKYLENDVRNKIKKGYDDRSDIDKISISEDVSTKDRKDYNKIGVRVILDRDFFQDYVKDDIFFNSFGKQIALTEKHSIVKTILKNNKKNIIKINKFDDVFDKKNGVFSGIVFLSFEEYLIIMKNPKKWNLNYNTSVGDYQIIKDGVILTLIPIHKKIINDEVLIINKEDVTISHLLSEKNERIQISVKKNNDEFDFEAFSYIRLIIANNVIGFKITSSVSTHSSHTSQKQE